MNLFVFVPLLLFSLRKTWGISVKKQILYSFLFVSFPFIIWDVVATRFGHWAFSEKCTLGFSFMGVPLEEIMFFFAIPFGCIYAWEALNKYKKDNGLLETKTVNMTLITLVIFGSLLLILGGGYSHISGALLIVTSFALHSMGWLHRHEFWRFQAVIYCLFVAFSLILTFLPVVTYGHDAITGWRFMTIPVENFAYSFVLINVSLLVYEAKKPRTK